MSEYSDKWIADASDYAEVRLNYDNREMSAMLTRMLIERPWDQNPMDWVDDFNRSRFPEDGDR